MTWQTPIISVLTCCYNAEDFVEGAIESILHQSYKEFEYLLVNDGSSDNTLSILKRYAAKDKRIVLIEQEHSGLTASLNLGLKQARGEWIARLDADDICEPARLQKQLTYVRANPQLVFVGSGCLEIDAKGNMIKNYRYPQHHAGLLKNLRTALKFPPHSSTFYLTSAVRKIGGYRPRIQQAQDMDLWLRLSEVGEFGCLTEPLVRIRKHDNQVSHEDSGRRQLIYSTVALVSYFLHQSRFIDPVNADQESFDAFYAWIEQQLKNQKMFAFRQFIEQLKACFYSSLNLLAAVLEVIRLALRQPNQMLRFLRQRLIADNLASRLAQEWKKQSYALS